MKVVRNFLSILLLITGIAVKNYAQAPDSLRLNIRQNLKNELQRDSAALMRSDSLQGPLGAAVPEPKDTPKVPKAVSPLAHPVEYEARDSIVMSLDPKKIFLYREAHIQYESLDLKAYYIEVDLDRKELYARGLWDSLSNAWQQRPLFTDKDKTFDADELRYNFETRQGLVTRIFTKEGEGYLHGDRVKYKPERYKQDTTEVVYVRRGNYTTCNAPHPHFGIRAGKIKVIPRKRVITGPAVFVVEDIPTPLAVPFGFFPSQEERTSGILFPQYGFQATTGFFLREGGYYWAVSPKVDFKFLGSLFTNGSWASGVASDYKIRYRMSGSLGFNYARTIQGNDPKIQSEFARANEWRFRWTHNQDPKALPGLSFRSDVNVVTAGYNKFNQFDITNFIQNTFTSTLALGYAIPRTPFQIQANLRMDQNTSTRLLNLNLPEIVWTTNRFFPFKSRKPRPSRWWRDMYEGLGILHRTEFGNRISLSDTLFSRHIRTLFAGYTINGIRHTLEAATTVKMFRYISLVPTFRYNEIWNFRKKLQYFDPFENVTAVDTLRGFYTGRTLSATLNANTNLFAFFSFKKGRVKGLRYMLQPTLGFSYAPYVSTMVSAYSGPNGSLQHYDPFQGVGVFGGASQAGTGALTFSLNNNLEMKMAPRKDSGQGDLKLKIIEFLGLNGSYNFFADSFQLSPFNIQTRNTYLKGRLSTVFSAVLDPYAIEQMPTGAFVRRPFFEFDRNRRLARLTSLTFNLNFSLVGKPRKRPQAPAPSPNSAVAEEWAFILNNPGEFVDFGIPYNLSLGYVLSYSRPLQQATLSNILTVSGDVRLTPNWKLDFRSAYDFVQRKFSPSATSLGLSRDLHCWQMDFQWIPFGTLASYVFTLRAKSALLQDLKLNRRRGWVPVSN